MTCVCVHLRPGIQFSYDNEYDTMFQLHRSRSPAEAGAFQSHHPEQHVSRDTWKWPGAEKC